MDVDGLAAQLWIDASCWSFSQSQPCFVMVCVFRLKGVSKYIDKQGKKMSIYFCNATTRKDRFV